MNDAPTTEELLDAVARVLTEEVVPATEGSTRHAVRIAANLCRIASRESTVAGTVEAAKIDDALAELMGGDDITDVARLLDDRLKADDAEFESAVADLLFADVCRRVDIAKPGYRTDEELGE